MILYPAIDLKDGQCVRLLRVQSHRLTADAIHYQRDGIHYLVVEEVVEDEGIVNLSHQEYGVTPPFAFPDPAE